MENKLCKLVKPDNVFEYIQLSIENGLGILLERCVECLLDNAEAIINGSGYADLSIDQLESILAALADRDGSQLKEILNHLLVKWAGADYNNRGTSLPSLIEKLHQSTKKEAHSSSSNFYPTSGFEPDSDSESNSRFNLNDDSKVESKQYSTKIDASLVAQMLQMQQQQLELQREDARENVKQFTDLFTNLLQMVQTSQRELTELKDKLEKTENRLLEAEADNKILEHLLLKNLRQTDNTKTSLDVRSKPSTEARFETYASVVAKTLGKTPSL